MTLAQLIARLTRGYIKETGKAPTGIDKLRIKMEAAEQLRQANKVIQFPQQRSFKQEIEAMIDDGTIKMGKVEKMNDNVRTRQMFQKSNLNKTEDQIKAEIEANNKKGLESIREKQYQDAVKKEQAKADADPDYLPKLIDPEDFAEGGIARAGFMAGGMGRRGFLKLLGLTGAGIAGAKTGLMSLSKQPAKQVAKEVVKQSAGTPPPYFFKLAEKIKMLGDDATATTDRTIAKTLKSKDGKSTYVLEEDVSTGDTIIKKVNKEGDEMITDVEIMEFKKGEVVRGKDGKAMKTPDEYEEVTEANARIEGDVFNDPYYSDGIQVDEIMKEVGEQAPSIKKADGGIMRAGYQMGGEVAYDATNKDIYGSSAATFTPATVMDQFGNQVQSEMGNDFNKPLIPQVTEQAANKPPLGSSGGITDIPAAGGQLNLDKTDLPIAGGNKNEMGILPVMPDKPTQMPDTNMSDEDIIKGFEEYKRQNPDIMNRPGTMAIVNLTLPGGTPMTFRSGAGAAALRQYLQSIGMEAGPGKEPFEPLKQPGGSLKALASGGVARLLGE